MMSTVCCASSEGAADDADLRARAGEQDRGGAAVGHAFVESLPDRSACARDDGDFADQAVVVCDGFKSHVSILVMYWVIHAPCNPAAAGDGARADLGAYRKSAPGFSCTPLPRLLAA